MSAQLDMFIALVRAIDDDERPGSSTSFRRRPAVAEAMAVARDVGVELSVNAMTEVAVVEWLQREARRRAIDAHYATFPEDRPSRAEVAAVSLRRRGDDLASRRDLLDRAEELLTSQQDVPPTIDEVIAGARVLAGGHHADRAAS